MLIVFVALFGLGLANELPEPRVTRLGSGIIEVSFEGVPGTQFREIVYGSDSNLKAPKRGRLFQSADGRWYHRNNNAHQLEENTPFHYKVSALKNGRKVHQTGVVSSDNSVALVPPKRVSKRGFTVLRDDFISSSLNTGEWDYEISMYGGYNWEIQVYTNDPLNVYLRNGNLYLKPTLTSDKFGESYLTTGVMDVAKIWGSCTNGDRYGCVREGRYGLLPPIMSGKIKTKKTITYGRVDVRAKIPKGDWIWPAIWLLPKYSHYGGWPASGEIDMMESRGNLRAEAGGNNHGVGEVSSTLHWGPDPNQNRFSWTHGEKDNAALWSSDFHVYSLDWNADHIICMVDNVPVLTVPTPPEGFWNHGHFSGSNKWASGGRNAPFDQPFYLILNVAIGGTNGFFPDGWTYNTPKPWKNSSPTEPADFWNKRNDWLPTWNGDDFYLILNVAIGGTSGFFPDGWTYNTPKPWKNSSPTEPADFWNKRNDWLPTWNGDDVAMQVDYVQMTQY